MAASSRDIIVKEEEEQDDTPDYSEDSLRQKTTVTVIGKVSFSQFMKDILPGLQLPKTVLDKFVRCSRRHEVYISYNVFAPYFFTYRVSLSRFLLGMNYDNCNHF